MHMLLPCVLEHTLSLDFGAATASLNTTSPQQ